MKNFNKKEFDCPCCGENRMKRSVMELLDMARNVSGVPYKISSGYRCKAHNTEVGGKETSSHLSGDAADILAENSSQRFHIIDGLIHVGFLRIGIGKDFIHADADHSKDAEVIWLY